jgi:hypothetical protein
MSNLFQIFFFRIITRTIGLYSRYFFFKLVKKERSLKSLSNEYKNMYKDFGEALNQDFINALVGTIVFLLFFIIAFATFS